jgi:hypothetical protein
MKADLTLRIHDYYHFNEAQPKYEDFSNTFIKKINDICEDCLISLKKTNRKVP